jgi:hypothetical protein
VPSWSCHLLCLRNCEALFITQGSALKVRSDAGHERYQKDYARCIPTSFPFMFGM